MHRYFNNLPEMCVHHRRDVPRHEAVDLHAGVHKDEERGMYGLCDRVKDGVADAMVHARCNKTKLNSLAFSPQATYTDRATAACRRN
jgi:hypothetical protein